MGIIKPWTGQGYVMRLEPSRKVATIVGVIVTAASFVGLIWLRERRVSPAPGDAFSAQPGFFTALTWFATGFLLLGYASAIVNGRRWRLYRAIVRLSNATQGRALQPRTEWTVQRSRATQIPPLRIDRGWTTRTPKPGRLSRVTSTRNVIGEAPMRVAYLRVFDNQPRARTFLQSAWREFGYVHMLRSASSVAPAEFRKLQQRGYETMFVRTREDLERELDAGHGAPEPRGLRAFRRLAPSTVRTVDWHGAYPPIAILCHGSYWREAVDELLARVDAVCLDLSGFRPKHEGTGYELQRVVDRFPIERVVFLVDPKSRLRFIENAILTAWTQMAAGSPNVGTQPRTTHLAATDRIRITIHRDTRGQETQRQTRLVAMRRRSRRVAAALQRALATAPPVPRHAIGHGTSHPQPLLDHDETQAPRRSPAGGIAAVLLTILAAAGLGLAKPGLVGGGFDVAVARTHESVEVADVIGRDRHQAVKALRHQRLRTQVNLLNSHEPAGTVLTQSPPAGSTVPRGSLVLLTVASPAEKPSPPPDSTRVPDVTFFSVHQATERLNQAHLRAATGPSEESARSRGTVLRTDPPPGQRVARGDTIVLFVASGWNTVPNVEGLDIAEAQVLLEQAGFHGNSAPAEDTTRTPGTVVAEPMAGQHAPLGITIELMVAKTETTNINPGAPSHSPTPTPTTTPSPTPTPSRTVLPTTSPSVPSPTP